MSSHIRMALRSGAHAICEKPLVLNPWNLDALAEIEQEYEKKVNTILQLRLHPSIIALKEKIDKEDSSRYTTSTLHILRPEETGTLPPGKEMSPNQGELRQTSVFTFMTCYHGSLESQK